jgi:dolichol-phosphate mannosyltransferase
MRARQAGQSKLGVSVVYEYLALLVNKLFRRIIPTRFVLFSLVGALGVVVHICTLWLVFRFAGHDFMYGQAIAIFVAMTHNYLLDNAFAFRDLRLTGLAFLRGLLSFYIVCSLGAFINLLAADSLHNAGLIWWQAGLAGAVIGAIWNYLAAARVTWRAE